MKLVVLAGAKQGTEIPLKKDKFLIGRAKDCTLRAGSESISRHHCAILRGEQGFSIRDLGSRNGTYVNDQKIEAETLLADGDEVQVGQLKFRVDGAADIDRSKQAKVKNVGEAISRSAAHAPQESGELEDDISNWLLGPEPGSSVSSKETQSIRIDETHTFANKPAKEPADEEVVEADAQAEESTVSRVGKLGSKKTQKKKPGKLPARPPKQQSKDSQEAAASILRDMTRRR